MEWLNLFVKLRKLMCVVMENELLKLFGVEIESGSISVDISAGDALSRG